MTIPSVLGADGLLPVAIGFWKQYFDNLAQKKLSRVFENAPRIELPSDSRLVFFADCHRGDSGRTDAFAPNEQLFLGSLAHYFEQGFTYIEVGDGDELWKNKGLDIIKKVHGAVFDWLHRFDAENRLHLILGNHEIGSRKDNQHKDGLPVQEGLILQLGDALRPIFVAHGHQADFKSDGLTSISRFVVRRVWRNLQWLGLANTLPKEKTFDEQKQIIKSAMRWIEVNQNKIEKKLLRWIEDTGNALICGHTHRPVLAPVRMPLYFNPGSCIVPGYITGLEIENRAISLVRWDADPDGNARRRRLRGPVALP